ncbi:MAG: hypothetical protein CMH54_14635 [Myxococcales bacterium]|nr:hypothetical protein [Myxococcales bacterium]|tara:strand:- start:1492 stop:2667 length:1176 start_codon:yes stop_codon:yes gene_type:complete
MIGGRLLIILVLLLPQALLADEPPESTPFPAIYDELAERTVRVVSGDRSGTGFFFGDGHHLITALHVVTHGRPIEIVYRDKTRKKARVVRTDTALDLAQLRVSTKDEALTVQPATVEPTIGTPVCLVGHPYPDYSEKDGTPLLQYTLSCGRITNRVGPYLVTDAAINPGQSGAALTTLSGQLVGVVVRRFRRGENLAQAVELSHIENLVAKPELTAFRGTHSAYVRLDYTWKGGLEGALRHGPQLVLGGRFFDRLEVGLLGGAAFNEHDGDSDTPASEAMDLRIGAETAVRFLAPAGSGRKVAISLGLGAALALRSSTTPTVRLTGPVPCTDGSQDCYEVSHTAGQTEATELVLLNPFLRADLGLFQIFLDAEIETSAREAYVGGGLSVEF